MPFERFRKKIVHVNISSQKSDSGEVENFGVPELKLALEEFETPKSESEVWAGKKSRARLGGGWKKELRDFGRIKTVTWTAFKLT